VSDASPTDEPEFSMRFWGVRGTIACPGADYIRYGGNTSCIEVRCGERLMILDAGTGLRALGVELARDGPIDVDLLLTHTHLDHLAGMPFFLPFFRPNNRIRLWAGHLSGTDSTLHDALKRMMGAPLFPVPFDALAADIDFKEFTCGERLHFGDGIVARTAPLNHPNGATGYRLEYGGRSICYVTDTEHVEGTPDANILGLIEGCDIFVYDATYTDEEYPKYRGWGHSTWEEGARLAEAAGVGQYVIFHHAPEHTDEAMDQIADAARRTSPNAIVAREGMILRP
jgi:phosphoribosyl 1,2-cyclic phosphodiesterase